MNYFFSGIIASIFLLNRGGSLRLHINISCGAKLLRILKIVLLKSLTFSLTLMFEKALSCPTKSVNCSSNKFNISIFVVPNLLQIRKRVCNFLVKYSGYNLMMTV